MIGASASAPVAGKIRAARRQVLSNVRPGNILKLQECLVWRRKCKGCGHYPYEDCFREEEIEQKRTTIIRMATASSMSHAIPGLARLARL
jgi:hypothetical protein